MIATDLKCAAPGLTGAWAIGIRQVAAAMLLLVAMAAAATVRAEPVVSVDGARTTVPLLPRAELVDPDGSLTPAEAAQRLRAPDAEIRTRNISRDFTKDVLWARVTLDVAPAAAGRWYFSLELPNFDRLQVFALPAGGGPPVPLFDLGDMVPRVTEIRSRFHLAPLALPVGTTALLLRGETTSTMTLDVNLRKLGPLQEEEKDFYALQLFYLGIATVLGLGALGLFAHTRQWIYLIYVVNLVAHCMVWLLINGTGPGYLWPDLAQTLHLTPQVFVAVTIFGTSAIAYHFLASARLPEIARQVLYAFTVFNLALSAIGVVLPASGTIWYALLVSNLVLPAGAILLTVTAIALIRGDRTALALMLTWVALIAAVGLSFLRNIGLVPNNTLTLTGPQLGSVVEMIVFAYMLVRRFGRLQAEKEQVQREALEAARLHRAELEQRVADRTAELDEAIRRERDARRLQQQFVAMVSHDFRTPLAIVDATAQNFATRAPEDLERLEKIRTATGRLRRMVDACLVDERVADGQIQLQPRDVDLSGLVDSLVELMRPAADGRRVVVTVPDDPVMASVDPGLLEMAVSNILENAFKYAPKGSTVEVAVAATPEGAEIAIADEGPGVPEQEREEIFARHYRSTNAAGIGGLGIGLHLVRTIVEAHSGSVACSSTPAGGSRFTIRLPAA
ncbi:ATP-binding protein [Thalassobaculum sp.]|uniref:sensor histidine kinase n=1 Tax=Thalassobaculum sp. TaxID=2022740 RepID=UPI003B5A28FD